MKIFLLFCICEIQIELFPYHIRWIKQNSLICMQQIDYISAKLTDRDVNSQYIKRK